jgi:hypothetical protein
MPRFLFLTSLIVLIAMLAAIETASAQDGEAECPPATELGELRSILTVSGTWSDGECDRSQFLENRPGQRFLFSLPDAAEVRIDLTSPERDTIVYLLAEDGRLLDADDDTGGGGNSRIERELPAGVYQIEAGALGWSGREGGSFELAVRVIEGCLDVVDLGVLVDTLSATGEWSHFGCESNYRADRAGQRYRFELTETRRVQIDLTSDLADAFVYLLDHSGALLESDDDGGVGLNSRIERFLGAGSYTIEATNWGDRDLKGLITSEFELTIASDEYGPIVKLEAIDAPERVVQGVPFQINYRVGNLGDKPVTALDANARLRVRVRWPYIDDWRTPWIDAADGETELWDVGASYHTSEDLQAFGSRTLPQLQPFEGLFRWRTGPTDVMLELQVINDDFDTLATHWLTRPIMVLSGFEFEPVTVSVEDLEYTVAAVADAQGEVTTDVTPIAGEGEQEELAPEIRTRAIYAAGVRTQVLADLGATIASLQALTESLHARVPRGGLPLSDVPAASTPTLDALVEALHGSHSETLVDVGFDPQQFQSAEAAEEILVRAGRAAARRIEQFNRDWFELTEQGRVISSSEALQVHAGLAAALHVDARLVDAAVLVLTKREAADGWDDPEVSAARDAFGGAVDCDVDGGALSFGDEALREVSPIYGLMLDRAYCGAAEASNDHDLLLSGLDLSANPMIPTPEVAEQPVEAPPAVGVRLLARVLEDGRVEFAVDLSDGERSRPRGRLQVDATVGRWLRSGPVSHDGQEIGRVHAQRLANGLVQATYVPSGAGLADTSRWIVPEDAPVDAWLISGALEGGQATSRDDLVQRVGNQTAGAGAAQFGDHLTLLSLIENDLQRNP